MKSTYIKQLFLYSIIITIIGCVPSRLEKKINSRTYQPIMVQKTALVNEKSSKTLFVEYVDETNMPTRSEVERKKWFFIDLVIMYYYKYDMVVSLGNNSCSPKAIDFYTTATNALLKRSGNYTLVEDTAIAPTRRAVITLKKIDINCDYKTTGFAVGSSSSQNETAGKAQGIVLVSLKVYNQLNEVVFENEYSDMRKMDHLSSSGKVKEVKFKAMNNLVEKLSASVEFIGIAINDDLNRVMP